MPLILEGLVTTLAEDGTMHLAPMGPIVDREMRTLLLRPFPTSQSFQNLKRHREGVFHVTDDAAMIAYAAVGERRTGISHRSAMKVKGFILESACRAYEFVVRSIDESGQRVHIEAEIVHSTTLREFFGFNRAKHAVIEAAILATRFDYLDLDDIAKEFEKFAVIIEKTGGAEEHEAFAILRARLRQHREE